MAQTTLEPATHSPARARRFVAECLHSLGLTALIDVATLLVSELVTNAVLHSGSRVHLAVHANGRIRVEVHDDSPAQPVVREYGDAAATGRGLLLVEALADQWGIEARTPGKTVWFELVRGAA